MDATWANAVRAVGLVVAAMLVAACGSVPLPGMQTTIPASDGTRALPVLVVDHAGIVVAVEPVQAAPPEDWATGAVRPAPGRPDAVLVSWVGGSCDDSAVLTIDPDGDRYRLAIESRSSAAGCDAVGHFRSVALTLARAVPEDAFVVAEPTR